MSLAHTQWVNQGLSPWWLSTGPYLWYLIALVCRNSDCNTFAGHMDILLHKKNYHATRGTKCEEVLEEITVKPPNFHCSLTGYADSLTTWLPEFISSVWRKTLQVKRITFLEETKECSFNKHHFQTLEVRENAVEQTSYTFLSNFTFPPQILSVIMKPLRIPAIEQLTMVYINKWVKGTYVP